MDSSHKLFQVIFYVKSFMCNMIGHWYVFLVLPPFCISASEEWEPFRLLRNRPVKPCSLTKFKYFIYI